MERSCLKAQTAGQMDHILVLRGIACLCVMANHLCGLVFNPMGSDRVEKALDLLTPYGFPFVWVFFFLSSYLLSSAFLNGRFALERGGVISYFYSRFWRLLPLLLFAQALVLLLGALKAPLDPAVFRFSTEWPLLSLWPGLMYSEIYNPIQTVNSPVWSVLLEIHFLILIPVVYFLIRKCQRFGVLLVSLLTVLSLIYGMLSTEIFPMIYQNHFYNLSFFLAGSLSAYRKQSLPQSVGGQQRPVMGWASLVTVILLVQILGKWNMDLALRFGGPVLLMGTWLYFKYVSFEFQRPLVQKWGVLKLITKNGWVSWFEAAGVMSYSIYLLHKPLGYLFINIATALGQLLKLGATVQIFVNLSLGVGLTLVVCTLCYFLIEVRFRRGLMWNWKPFLAKVGKA